MNLVSLRLFNSQKDSALSRYYYHTNIVDYASAFRESREYFLSLLGKLRKDRFLLDTSYGDLGFVGEFSNYYKSKNIVAVRRYSLNSKEYPNLSYIKRDFDNITKEELLYKTNKKGYYLILDLNGPMSFAVNPIEVLKKYLAVMSHDGHLLVFGSIASTSTVILKNGKERTLTKWIQDNLITASPDWQTSHIDDKVEKSILRVLKPTEGELKIFNDKFLITIEYNVVAGVVYRKFKEL